MRKWTLWFDNSCVAKNNAETIAWARVMPFMILHVSCSFVYFTGWSPVALYTALFLYWLRIFAIGAFYHRYFSHRTFQTHRIWQFIFAVLGATAVQRGPIWWAAHHRQHHIRRVTDTRDDPHSPWAHTFWRSHVGWFLSHKNFHYDPRKVKDLLRFPELCWLDRYDVVIPIALILLLFLMGVFLNSRYPELGCSGGQMVVWGFCISTIATLHTTVSVNSFGHKYGSRRYRTPDKSRNNWILALLTLGEGWHNNHHRYPATAKQGFRWWELDITYYILVIMEKVRIIYGLKGVPTPIVKESQDA